MMRASPHETTNAFRATRAAMKLSAVSVIALVGPLATEPVAASPGSFTLPEPTPTPTPVPQGPVDERAGVPIAPRVIPLERAPEPLPAPPTPTPSPTPTQAETQTSASPPEPEAEPASEVSPAAEPSLADETGPDPSEADAEAPEDESETVAPGFETLPIPEAQTTAPSQDTTISGEDDTRPDRTVPDQREDNSIRNLIFALIALAALLAAGLGWTFWRRNRDGDEDQDTRAGRIVAKVNRMMPDTTPPVFKGRADPALSLAAGASSAAANAALEPIRLDLSLEIASASCSVMNLTLECRIVIANRSDQPARDLTLFGDLSTARAGEERMTYGQGKPIEAIDRIGPRQIRRIRTMLQLPLREINAIRQGERPVFVPLAHIRVEGSPDIEFARSFVIGSRSAANRGRLHPLPLDVSPGGVHGLIAQPVREPVTQETEASTIAATV